MSLSFIKAEDCTADDNNSIDTNCISHFNSPSSTTNYTYGDPRAEDGSSENNAKSDLHNIIITSFCDNMLVHKCNMCSFQHAEHSEVVKHCQADHCTKLKMLLAGDACDKIEVKKVYRCKDCNFMTPFHRKLLRHQAQRCKFSLKTNAAALKQTPVVHTPVAVDAAVISSSTQPRVCTRASTEHAAAKQMHLNVNNDACVVDDVERQSHDFRCSYCKLSFTKRLRMKRHVENVHGISVYPWRCPQCSLAYISKFRLVAHIQAKHGECSSVMLQNLKCVDATGIDGVRNEHLETCGSMTDLVHDSSHSTATAARVSREGRMRRTAASKLRRNYLLKTAIRKFRCRHCAFATTHLSSLKRHEMAIHGEVRARVRPFVCELCGYRCEARYLMNRHLKNHHSNAELSNQQPAATAEDVNFRVSSRRDSTPHSKRSISDGVPTPAKRRSMDAAVVAGTPPRAVVTQVASWERSADDVVSPDVKSVDVNGNSLQLDVMKGRGAKSPHLLQNAVKRTATRRTNKKRHGTNGASSREGSTVFDGEQGGKLFQCGICSLAFDSVEALRSHASVAHAGDRRFKCKLCGKRSNFKWNLQKHVRTVHKILDCNHCCVDLSTCVTDSAREACSETRMLGLQFKKQCAKSPKPKVPSESPLKNIVNLSKSESRVSNAKQCSIESMFRRNRKEEVSRNKESMVDNKDTVRLAGGGSPSGSMKSAALHAVSSDDTACNGVEVTCVTSSDVSRDGCINETPRKSAQLAEPRQRAKGPNPAKYNAGLLSEIPSRNNCGRVYKCSRCPRTFTRSQALYQHIAAHTDLRRYQCTVCGLRSNGGGNIRRHVRNVHSSNASFVCLSRAVAAESIASYKQLLGQRKCAPRKGKLGFVAGRVARSQASCRSGVETFGSEAAAAAPTQNCLTSGDDDACRSSSAQSATDEYVQSLGGNVVSCAMNEKCSVRSKSTSVASKKGKLGSLKKGVSLWKCRFCDFRSSWQWSLCRHMKTCKRRAAIKRSVDTLNEQRDVSDQESQESTVCADSQPDAKDERQPKKIDSYFRKSAVFRRGLGPYACSQCCFRTNRLPLYRKHLSACDPVAKAAKLATGEAERMSANTTTKYVTRSRNSHSSATSDSHVATDEGIESRHDSSNVGKSELTDEGLASDERKRSSQSGSCALTGSRIYKCSCCGFKSKWRSVIRRHLSHCNPAARLVDSSVADAKSHHRFKCSLCSYSTNWSSALYRHRKALHRNAANIVNVKEAGISPVKAENVSHVPNGDAQQMLEQSEDHVGSEDVLRLWRFACSLCSYRSNYRGNVHKHQVAKHGGRHAAVRIMREDEARMTLENYFAFLSPKRRTLVDTAPRRRTASSSSSGAIRTAQRSASGCVKRGTNVGNSAANRKQMKAGRIDCASDSISGVESKMASFPDSDKQTNERSNCASRLRSPTKTDAKLQWDETPERSRCTNISSSPVVRKSSSNVARILVTAPPPNAKKKSYLDQRQDAMMNVRRYKCSACDFRSSWHSVVFKHRKRIHPKAQIIRLSDAEVKRSSCNAAAVVSRKSQCRSCPYKAFSRLDLERHVSQVHSKTDVESFSKRIKAKMQERLDAEANLRRFKCSMCDYRTNWTADAYRHRKRFHNMTSGIIRLSIEEANATRGNWSYRRRCEIKCTSCSYRSRSFMDLKRHRSQAHRPGSEASCVAPDSTKPCQPQRRDDVARNLQVFKCSECSFRTKYGGNFNKHRKRFHSKAKMIPLNTDETKAARGSRNSFGRSETGSAASAAARESSADECARTVPPKEKCAENDDDETDAPSRDLSASAGSQSKASSKDSIAPLRRFACPFCFLRSNHRQVVSRHLKRKHPGKLGVIKVLSNVTNGNTLTDHVRQRSGALSAKCTTRVDRDVRLSALGGVMPPSSDHASPKRRSPGKIGGSGGDCVSSDSRHVMRSPTAEKITVGSGSLPWKHCMVGGVWLLCGECPFLSRYRSNLVQHRLLHRPRTDDLIKCDSCSFTADRAPLTKHSIVHRPKYAELRATGRCSTVTVWPAQLPTSAVVYACDSCPFVSRLPHTMTVHKQNHRPRDDASYKCGRCSFRSCDRSSVAKHAHVHRRGYAERRVSSLCASPTKSMQAPPPLPQPLAPVEMIDFKLDVDVDDDVIEMAAIKHRVVASRFGLSKCFMNAELANSSRGSSIDDGAAADSAASRIPASPASRRSAVVAADSDVGCGGVEKKLRSWRCDKCPYSIREIERFKRHVSLHGRRLTFQCNYCNYSVLSYWRLAEHRRLHLVQNRNLLHSQSVANLILLPSRSLPPDAIGDDACPIGNESNFFENSDDFAVPPYPQFRCVRCPFASEHRRDFRQHVQCHFARSRLSCPFCDFSTPSSRSLLCHVMLHFNLPGSDTSALAPSHRSAHPWKSVVADILSYLRKFSDNARKSDDVSFADCCDAAAVAAADDNEDNLTDGGGLDDGRHLSANDGCQRDGELQDSQALKELSKQIVSIKSEAISSYLQDDDEALAAAAATLDIHNGDSIKNEETSSVVGCRDGSSVDVHVAVCQYCDRPLSSLHQLAKHEAGHLIGHPF